MALNHVEPGGAPHVEQLPGGITLTKFSVDPMDNDVYLLTDGAGTVLIDAANDAARIHEVLAGRPVTTIVTTHQHHDHVQALAEVAAETGARVLCGSPDADAIERQTGVRCEPVWTGDTVALAAGQSLEVIGLVGHTPGSIALALRPESGPVHLFTGDSLFPGGPGKTTSPQDFTSLVDDLTERVFGVFDDDTVVHPGHGDDTTLGDERPQLDEWCTRGW